MAFDDEAAWISCQAVVLLSADVEAEANETVAVTCLSSVVVVDYAARTSRLWNFAVDDVVVADFADDAPFLFAFELTWPFDCWAS